MELMLVMGVILIKMFMNGDDDKIIIISRTFVLLLSPDIVLKA